MKDLLCRGSESEVGSGMFGFGRSVGGQGYWLFSGFLCC